MISKLKNFHKILGVFGEKGGKEIEGIPFRNKFWEKGRNGRQKGRRGDGDEHPRAPRGRKDGDEAGGKLDFPCQ